MKFLKKLKQNASRILYSHSFFFLLHIISDNLRNLWPTHEFFYVIIFFQLISLVAIMALSEPKK